MKNARTSLALMTVLSAGAWGAGCGAKSPGVAAPPQLARTGACARSQEHLPLAPIGGGTGSTVALGRQGERTLAFVIDEEDKALRVIDVDKREELEVRPLSGTPAQVLVAEDGRVLVSLRDKNQVEVLEPKEGGQTVSRCSIDTAEEPIGLAQSKGGKIIAVTSGWGQAVTLLDGAELHVTGKVHVGREPRAAVFSEAGDKLYVSHLVGSAMSVVDVETRALRKIPIQGPEEQRRPQFGMEGEEDLMVEPARPVKGKSVAFAPRKPQPPKMLPPKKFHRVSGQGFALAKVDGSVMMPHVLIDQGDVTERAPGYGDGERPAHIADIFSVDEKDGSPKARAEKASDAGRLGFRAGRNTGECLLPRGATQNEIDGTLLVTCLGVDEVREFHVGEKGAMHVVRSWQVPSGPTGIAFDKGKGRAVVWSEFDHALSVIPLPQGSLEERLKSERKVYTLSLSRKATVQEGGDVALGRKLFHASGNQNLSFDGRACASCHPDGREDSLTWATPDGPRQTPMLAGRLEKTAPFAWSGSGRTIEDHLSHTFQRLRASGLQGRELDALVAYCKHMKGPTHGFSDKAKVSRGEAIFNSAEAGCATCHTTNEKLLTDQTLHDVSSKAKGDNTEKFDTPSLRFVGGTAPYYHDGRYATLADLLKGADGTMGHTKHLSTEEMDALVTYLKTL